MAERIVSLNLRKVLFLVTSAVALAAYLSVTQSHTVETAIGEKVAIFFALAFGLFGATTIYFPQLAMPDLGKRKPLMSPWLRALISFPVFTLAAYYAFIGCVAYSYTAVYGKQSQQIVTVKGWRGSTYRTENIVFEETPFLSNLNFHRPDRDWAPPGTCLILRGKSGAVLIRTLALPN